MPRKSEKALEYPEHERMRAVHDKAQMLGAFLEWLESDGRKIGEYHEHGEDCEHAPGDPPGCGMVGKSHTGRYYLPPLYTWEPPGRGERIERILAEYLGIDMEKIRAEKDAMVAELQRQAKEQANGLE